MNERIKIELNQASKEWGMNCLNYEILEIVLPDKISTALDEVAKAERIRRNDIILSEA